MYFEESEPSTIGKGTQLKMQLGLIKTYLKGNYKAQIKLSYLAYCVIIGTVYLVKYLFTLAALINDLLFDLIIKIIQ